jgi:hypothetical protein
MSAKTENTTVASDGDAEVIWPDNEKAVLIEALHDGGIRLQQGQHIVKFPRSALSQISRSMKSVSDSSQKQGS